MRSDNTPARARARLLHIAFAVIAIIFPQLVSAQDIFIGMVVEDGSGLILERCQAGKARYRLRAAAGADDPLAEVRGKQGLVQARIYGHYRAEGEAHAIDVMAVDEVQFGKTCHLVDALEAYTPENTEAEPMAAATVEIGNPDASLVGHYYLSGVMETGSELLLKADGRFEWYISYGAVDQATKGRWGRAGQTVSLVADLASADAPLFRVDEVFPWDEVAERYLRENERLELEEVVAARCPWNVATATTLWSYDLQNPKPASDAEIETARQAKRAAEVARDEASRIIAKAVATSANSDERAAADVAMEAWYAAQSKMAQAHHDANLPEPEIGSPALPLACQIPPDGNYSNIPETQWRRGVAVLVGDPAREMRLSRVEATFVFGDGHRETTKTRRGGFAFAPVRKDTAVEQIVLSLPETVSRSATLNIKPLSEGIQAVIVDTDQIVEPAFGVMHLEVNGKDLLPQNMPRGRYSRN